MCWTVFMRNVNYVMLGLVFAHLWTLSMQQGDCDFDTTLCGYQQDNTDDFDWTRQQGTTGTDDTGPSSDHTTGNGYYMYIETSSPQLPGHTARLTSPNLSNDIKCLEFWYHMYGDSTEELNVYVRTTGSFQRPGILTWSKSGDKGDVWRHARVHLEQGSDFNVVFEGVRGSSYRGDIAIDDVSFRTESCGGQCDFDNGLCGYQQDNTGDFDWTRQQGTTGTTNTGPSSDHTTGLGYYMYIETSDPRVQGDIARLVSPVLSSDSRCLEFWYHMYGSGTGELRVYQTSTGSSQLGTPKWSLTGDQGNVWRNATVGLEAGSNFHVVFEGVRGSNLRGDIAIDDVTVRATSCGGATVTTTESTVTTSYPATAVAETTATLQVTTPAPTTQRETTEVATTPGATTTEAVPSERDCNFDTDVCGYQQDSTDDFDWTRKIGTTSSSNTGPSSDHTTGSGYYMYIETSSQATGNVARLITPSLPTNTKCLEFWYHMYGSDTEELRVYQRPTGTTQLETPIWSLSGEQGDIWDQAMVEVVPVNNFEIVFEGVRGSNFRGDIAIDDVRFRATSCPDGNCNFDIDSTLCGYHQDNTDDFDWTLQQGETGTDDTGPSSDHTSGAGYYMYIETSSPRQAGDLARLVSPVLSGDTRCLEFWYHMYGDHTEELRVYLRSTGSAELGTLIWSQTGDQGDVWIQATVDLVATRNFYVVFEGVRGTSYRGDIAIDDISFRKTPCVVTTMATTTTTLATTTPSTTTDTVVTTNPMTTEATTTTPLQTTTYEPSTEGTTTSFEPLITYMTTTSSTTTFPSATTDIVTTDIVTTTTPLKTTTYEPSTEGTTSTLQPSTTYMKTTTSITTHETTEEAAATTSEYATTMPTATTVTTDDITSSTQQAFTTTEPMSTPAVTLELTTESETTSVVPTTSTTTQQTSSPDLTTTLEETTEDLSTLSPTTVETTTTITTDEDTTHVATTAPPIAISSVTTISQSTVAKETTTASHVPSTTSTDVPTTQPPDTTSLSTTKQLQVHTTKQSTTKPEASTATQPTAKPGQTKPSTGKPTTEKAPPCGKDCTTVPDYKVTGKSEAQGGLSIGIIVGAGAGGAVVVIVVVVIIIVAVKCRRSNTNRRKNSDWEVANPMYDVAMGPTKNGNNNNKNGGKRDDDFYTFNMNTSNV